MPSRAAALEAAAEIRRQAQILQTHPDPQVAAMGWLVDQGIVPALCRTIKASGA